MNIGIDARFWGLEHAGLGRYVMELVSHLARLDRKNRYTLFLRKPYDKELKLPKNFALVSANIRHYTIEEQWLLAEIFSRANLDLLHVPHFNVPLLYRRPFIVTIHDLLWHEVKGLSVTTQNTLVYLVKYIGYRAIVSRVLKNSVRILVPSKVIRDKLVNERRVERKRVQVTYEAPSKIFRPVRKKASILAKYRITEPFVIYVGSAYPHKNIAAAAAAAKLINDRGHTIKLVVASSRSVFLDRLRRELKKQGSEKFVRLVGFVPDYDLVILFAHAKALIQPSLSEGFGLTGLEAMAAGLPVIASKLKVFEEIYKDAAVYIDPQSPEEIADELEKMVSNENLRQRVIKAGLSRTKQFSWSRLAKKTLQVYEDAAEAQRKA
ncbi:glycosyltransferase family 4 protein [Patescibacteria group bacterium]|nr:glycosyltransferase family 4 protein [Patescibacteria group bacterium]